MMARRKQQNGLYYFLEREGVLATVDELLIQDAKRRYWAAYKKEWRKTKRAQSKVFTIYLDEKDYRGVRKAAGAHSMSPTRFIKQAALAIAQKDSFVDPVMVGQVREAIALCISDIEELVEGGEVKADMGEAILERIEQMEDKVINSLTNTS